MRGVTIIELIVCMIITSIMLMGILSANYAMQRMDKNISSSSALYTRTLFIVNHITETAINAKGALNSVGVCLNNTSNNANYICFRNSPNWICYTRLNTSGSNVGSRLFNCSFVDNANLTGSSATACAAAGQGACTTTATELGTIASDVFTGGVWPSFASSGFNMPVTNRVNPTAVKSLDNPEVRMWISAYPEGHSF